MPCEILISYRNVTGTISYWVLLTTLLELTTQHNSSLEDYTEGVRGRRLCLTFRLLCHEDSDLLSGDRHPRPL